MSTPQVEFPPLVNGLDYMESVVEQLQGEPTSRQLKYAILHLVAGTEVLLKARLSEEHWSLVFENPGNATKEALQTGDFRSCSIEQALKRLVDVAGLEFSGDASQVIRGVQEKRNRLHHFGLTDSAPAIQAVAIGALNFLISFVTEQLADDLSEPAATESLERIRRQLAGIDKLVSLRLSKLAQTLDARDVIVTCPECTQLTLEPGDRCLCHFCGASGEPETIAREYLYTVLGEDEYSAGKGRTGWSLDACPDCGQETLVEGVVVRGHPPDRDGLFWCCFAQAVTWREMGECMHCGRAIQLEEEGPDLCEDCLAAAFERY